MSATTVGPDTAEIVVEEETAEYLLRYRGGYTRTEEAAREWATEQDWSGFGLVMGPDGPLEVPGHYVTGRMCEYIRRASNVATAYKWMADATGEPRDADGNGGYVTGEWNGWVAYDAARPDAAEAARRIALVLADLGFLDTEDVDAREDADVIETLGSVWHISDTLAPSVLEALRESGAGLCSTCDSWDVVGVLASLGHKQCEDCYEWLRTDKDETVLCYDCAESRQTCDAGCVSVMVDGFRHGSHVVTVADAESACECESPEWDD